MKKNIYLFAVLITLTISCKDDEINKFDKSADERVSEAVATLKADLVAPKNGWLLRYTPTSEAGTYNVLLDFNEDNTVNIKSDIGADDGAYFDQTITYRIDNSLGLELIFESYSIFSYLFELDQASFGAEFEFNFVNKTPDNALVFTSKSDFSQATRLLFEEASASAENLLGRKVALDLTKFSDDLGILSSSLKLSYANKDLVLYLSLDNTRRVIDIHSASLKSNTESKRLLNFSQGYVIEGNTIKFNAAFTGNVLGTNLNFNGITFNTLSDATLEACAKNFPINTYSGVTSSNDVVVMETSLLNAAGSAFGQVSNFYYSPLAYAFDNGTSVGSSIANDIQGAQEMHLYYGAQLQNGSTLYGIGYAIVNNNGSVTFALKEFTPELHNNNLIFHFKDGITLLGSEETDAAVENIQKYLDPLVEGNSTYVLRYGENIIELYNPCSGWSFVFGDGN
ncbi:DUF4302 domain-containing protein [Chryseosolibacter indicus]|uniref:DUF4302 domain-containing protein n=1 Tax=Chryseosolibacter indicus TaxID=2782351 RepID=A0ABS5VW91_9BACT|nr:DUF4302 domain-containing protein [Chryseosolibacter indicus]MBT1705692.1 DUF4302 domain-containing protein [Chryseosolibacter indicus]